MREFLPQRRPSSREQADQAKEAKAPREPQALRSSSAAHPLGADASAIQRLATAEPAGAQRLLLDMQRQHGNRHVQRLLDSKDDRAKQRAHEPDSSAQCGCSSCAARDRAAKDRNRDGAAAGAPVATAGGGGAASGKDVTVYPVSLPGSTRSPDPDITRANTIWGQCSVKVTSAGGESWATDVLDRQSPTGVLNEFSNPASPTTEEVELLGHQPGGSSVIHAYYVPSMSAGSRGEAFLPSITPSLPKALVISDSAASDTLAHELGHIILNEAGHHADADNVMASGTIRNVGVDKLDAAQCSKV